MAPCSNTSPPLVASLSLSTLHQLDDSMKRIRATPGSSQLWIQVGMGASSAVPCVVVALCLAGIAGSGMGKLPGSFPTDAASFMVAGRVWMGIAMQAQGLKAIGNGTRKGAGGEGSVLLVHLHLSCTPTPPQVMPLPKGTEQRAA